MEAKEKVESEQIKYDIELQKTHIEDSKAIVENRKKEEIHREREDARRNIEVLCKLVLISFKDGKEEIYKEIVEAIKNNIKVLKNI